MNDGIFRLQALPARNGDALVIEYGTSDRSHRVLVDGGVSKTADLVADFLGVNAALELLVVTHIDNDHIAGMVKLMEGARRPRPRDLWFNGYRHLPGSAAEAMGPVEGERLTKLIEEHHYHWNGAFHGHAVTVGASAPPRVTLEDGLACTVLSPGLEQLKALRKKTAWTQVVQEAGLDPAVVAPAEVPSPAKGLERMGDLLDIDALADAQTTSDSAVANGSSIALLLEFGGRRCLLAGDAHPGVLIAGIDQFAGTGAALNVDVFKLPHHGSKANVTTELIRRVPAHTYVFCTDGSGNQHHPDDSAVARVIRYGPAHSRLAFNYGSARNRRWDNPGLKSLYKYRTQYPPRGKQGITIDVLG